jgi:nucleotide-binding universal stress UspA family protein
MPTRSNPAEARMEDCPFHAILHPTDLSEENESAFVHAARLALAGRSALHLLHVEEEARGAAAQDRFPKARELFARWGLIDAGAEPKTIEERLGVRIINSSAASEDIASAIGAYAEAHSCDLLVLATHAAGWLERLLAGSVAEESARLSHAPALFLRAGAHGFVEPSTGRIRLRRVLMPVSAEVPPMHAWGFASPLVRLLEPTAEFHLLHVGDTLPTYGNLLPHVELRRGSVVETILAVAEEIGPDLIVMATEGHKDLIDAITGSTTEQVLREAPCPVLTAPSRARRPAV